MRPRWDASEGPGDGGERDGLDALVQFLGWLVTGGLGPVSGEAPSRRLPWHPFRRAPERLAGRG